MNTLGSVPDGVLALAGDALRRQRQAEQRCLALLEESGFEPVHLPVLEYDDASRSRGYRFVEPSGRVVALRTDFTPQAMRLLAPELSRARGPVSVCYAGEVVRPRSARLRQLPELYQLGFETFGVEGGGAGALELMLRLADLVGVDTSRCHLALGVAHMAEEIVGRLANEAEADELVELLRVRDLDALVDATGVVGPTRSALERALFGEVDDGWSAELGVAETVQLAEPMVATCRRLGVPCSLDVAAGAVGDYYRGATFSLWGEKTHSVVAAGGEYAVEAGGRSVPAVGACLTLSLALEEASC